MLAAFFRRAAKKQVVEASPRLSYPPCDARLVRRNVYVFGAQSMHLRVGLVCAERCGVCRRRNTAFRELHFGHYPVFRAETIGEALGALVRKIEKVM